MDPLDLKVILVETESQDFQEFQDPKASRGTLVDQD
jgi:hypothetical protein